MMYRYITHSFGAIFFLLMINGLSVEAVAYVLKGPHVLDLMIQQFKGAKTLMIKQKLMIYNAAEPGKVDEFSEILRYAFPETFRSDIQSPDTQKERIQVLTKSEILTIMGGKISSTSETRFERYKDILLYRPRTLLQNHLEQLDVDVWISSLGRFQGKIAFVLGSEYPDESRSQLWIEKDTFLPLRWLLLEKDSAYSTHFFEIRYLKWQQFAKTWYPMRIEFYQGGVLKREIRVETVQVNPSFIESLFDIRQLSSIYRRDPELPPNQRQP